jgi:ABC-type multidrug transport system permease subunit
LVQGELACVQGELFVDLELWFGCLRFLFEHSFVSDVSSRCLPKGSDTCLLQVILLFAFLWLSIACWSFFLFISFLFFFLVLLYVGVLNALIKGEIEDHVWFEDRWMVAS